MSAMGESASGAGVHHGQALNETPSPFSLAGLRRQRKAMPLSYMIILATLLLLPLVVMQQFMDLVSEMSWLEVPLMTSAHYLLLRTICSRADQQRIQQEYTAVSAQMPQLSFDQFILQKYPQVFQGYRTTQQEVVAAVATCLAAEKDIRFVRSMSKAAGMARDPKAAVDRVADALRHDYPKYFQG